MMQYVRHYNPKYEQESAKLFPKAVSPEFRLEMVLYAGPCFAASFFWFGYERIFIQQFTAILSNSADRWTSFPHISYWGPMLSGLLMGFSIQLIFVWDSVLHIDIGRSTDSRPQ